MIVGEKRRLRYATSFREINNNTKSLSKLFLFSTSKYSNSLFFILCVLLLKSTIVITKKQLASQQNYLTTDTSYRSFLSINLLYLNQHLFKTCSVGSTDILTQTDTHQSSSDGSVTIDIEGYPLISAICRRCAEIR